MKNDYLPMNRHDMSIRGWKQCDFIYVSGDAYVDHPSFGTAIISRILEAHGYKVGIIAQPDWKDKKSIEILGRPRLGFLVSAGNMDSMVNHYSVSKKRRKEDSYTPGGVMGKRPDRPTIVYTQILKRLFPHKPVLIGGIEASLRRLSHYDYWDDKIRRSILWWKVTIHKRKCRVLICKKSPKWRAWTAVILPAVRWRAVLHGTENTLIFHRIARISEYIYILTECTATVQYISMNII